MSNKYTSKYPTIMVDRRSNSVNESLQKKLTIEEYYDLMHHTHNINDLITNEGGMSYGEMQSTICNLTKMVEDLSKTVVELSKQVANAPAISDWDVETPGIQDIDGNTLGDLMGFTMTEIE